MLAGCGAASAADRSEPPRSSAPAADVRVRIADEAQLDRVDPSIIAHMESAARAAYRSPEQMQLVRAEVVLHHLAVDASGQTRASVRVTLVQIANERICTVLEGGAAAANASEQAVIEASMRAALREIDQELADCVSVASAAE